MSKELEAHKVEIINFYESYLRVNPKGIAFLTYNQSYLTKRIQTLKKLTHLIGYNLEIEKAKFEIQHIKKLKTMKSQGLKKPSVRGLKTVCHRVIKVTGLKVDGTLKKGYKYEAGGKVVKIKPPVKKKPVAKKKPATKKPVSKKKPVARKKVVKK